MRLNNKYLEKINFDYNTITTNYGYLYSKEDLFGNIIKDVKYIDFENLYSCLLIGFYDKGLLCETVSKYMDSSKEHINDIKTYLRYKYEIKESSLNEYERLKVLTNSFISRFFSKGESSYLFNLCVLYLKEFYGEVLEFNKDNILYIDTDCIYYKGDIILPELPVLYHNKSEIDIMCFHGMKRYVGINNGKIISKGNFVRKDEIVLKLKTELRESKINEILS
jgi:hypothetical protein